MLQKAEVLQRAPDIPVAGRKLVEVTSSAVGGADFIGDRGISAGAGLGDKFGDVVTSV